MDWDEELKEMESRRARALMMGGEEKIARKHDKGRLTAREWIDRLLDNDSFMELGLLDHSDMQGMEEKTPADSKIDGYGIIDGRTVAVMACDFTVLSSTSSRVALKKESEIRHQAAEKGLLALENWICQYRSGLIGGLLLMLLLRNLLNVRKNLKSVTINF